MDEQNKTALFVMEILKKRGYIADFKSTKATSRSEEQPKTIELEYGKEITIKVKIHPWDERIIDLYGRVFSDIANSGRILGSSLKNGAGYSSASYDILTLDSPVGDRISIGENPNLVDRVRLEFRV